MDSNTGQNSSQVLAILAYLGPLVIISYLVGAKDPFVKFHVKQGLVLFAVEIIIQLLFGMFFLNMWQFMQLLSLATLVLAIIGIVNVVQKKEKMLPVIGGFASHFKF